MPGIDLHLHSTHSDGTYAPSDLVARARELGLHTISITDHDTVDGIAEALAAGRELGIEVIPGVELSAERAGVGLHILGYWLDWTDEVFLDRLRTLRHVRLERAQRIVSVLADAGFTVSLDDVLSASEGGAVGRAHIARALIANGHASDMRDAFQRFLGEHAPYFVPKPLPDPAEAIRWIVAAGGVAVLAHPGISGADGLIAGLVRDGLRGLEVYHGSHDDTAIERYLRAANEFHLIVTGGSDFHGSPREGGAMGSAQTPSDSISLLRDACRGGAAGR